ncbi:Cobalt-precorrin-5A hydrolase [Geodia barretti]|uniref:Cobalt-precorrin-5A hydrolase n=1 Tax=Geodia barretti TaxID=519541 RepID=A0AA35TJP2_GEOBA|nr:Cobalt-precorrin-5A hydrolase [Geodia barretti]
MVLFLSITRINKVVRELKAGAYTNETPVAVVYRVGWPDQLVITGTLGDIAPKVKRAGITLQALVLVGAAFDTDIRRIEAADGRLNSLRAMQCIRPRVKPCIRAAVMADATAIVAISRRGAAIGGRVRDALGGGALYVERRFADAVEGATAFDLPARPLVGRLFNEYERLVLMMPVGAAVRLLAAHIGHKHTDAAAVCVDDAGRFAVSLLSGHVGGGDALAERVADALGATAVITSASHVLGTLAVDLLGSEFGWRIEASSVMVTRASAAVVNGEPVGGCTRMLGERDWWDAGKPLPSNVNVAAQSGGGDWEQAGRWVAEVEGLLRGTFAAEQLAVGSVRCIATAELKRDEAAIGLLAERLGVPVRYYGAEELNGMPGPSGASESQRLLGIVGVAEPAALLASGGEIVVPKVRSAAATLAVARINYPHPNPLPWGEGTSVSAPPS